MAAKKRKILVHVCCAACASYVFSELEKEEFEITAFFYNPEIHGRAEYKKRLNDVSRLCNEREMKLIAPDYNMQEFLLPLMPYQDRHSIKYISDKGRYRRKRCKLCLDLLIKTTFHQARKMRYKYFTSTMLCSPYKEHDEVWDFGLELATQHNMNFFYKDFRKGYWMGRNFARSHDIMIASYCGCNESLQEGRLE